MEFLDQLADAAKHAWLKVWEWVWGCYVACSTQVLADRCSRS